MERLLLILFILFNTSAFALKGGSVFIGSGEYHIEKSKDVKPYKTELDLKNYHRGIVRMHYNFGDFSKEYLVQLKTRGPDNNRFFDVVDIESQEIIGFASDVGMMFMFFFNWENVPVNITFRFSRAGNVFVENAHIGGPKRINWNGISKKR